MQLSADLRNALDTVVSQSAFSALKTAAEGMSLRYRNAGCTDVRIRDDHEARAYLATRFPATFAAARSVFEQIAAARPDFLPRSVLDVGAGPGTVALAALSVWPDIESVDFLEPNNFLSGAGRAMIETLDIAARMRWIKTDVKAYQPGNDHYDLVVSGYMLNEVARGGDVRVVAEKLWMATDDTLAMIETGTPVGGGIILDVRDHVLSLGGQMIAPCPHKTACPLAGNAERWCHFTARVDRSKTHRALKDGATLGYEDEKFSYIALGRKAGALPQSRVIGYPSGTKVIELQLCQKSGVTETVWVAKSDDRYKSIRKITWGDAF